jgi:hypothetical protein
MSAGEFVRRLQPACKLPPIAFRPKEYYYMQSELPPALQEYQTRVEQLLQAIGAVDDLAGGGAERQPVGLAAAAAARAAPEAGLAVPCQDPAALQESAGPGSGTTPVASTSRQARGQLKLSQAPKLWISPSGAVSPLHYDLSHSFLVQVHGHKRMLFFSLDQLYRLYCYPDTHLLRRRSRVNIHAPDLDKFPLFRDVGALEVMLSPGDVLFFPSRWAHYTESLGGGMDASTADLRHAHGADGDGSRQLFGCCVSLTFRVSSSSRA